MAENVLRYLAASAEARPDKTAAAMRDDRLTFAELRSRAACLAGAIPETLRNAPIGVFAGRDTETLLLFMAVLYSGNFYIPIDPDMPPEKLRAILEDATPPVLLGTEETAALGRTPAWDGLFLTPADAAAEERPFPAAGGDDPAYMIYTSGSTGKPKGVLKSHGAVISFIETYCGVFDFSAEDVIGNQTPFFFDASAKDLYLMLKTGATMEILPTELFAMPPNLIEYLNERRVTFLSWVPTALSIVAQLKTFSFVKPTTVSKVFFVGEVMPMKHLNAWRAALPEARFVNLYGASELAGVCCCYEVAGAFGDDAVLPMGRPLPNCRLYLMDGDERITAPGRTGELYLVSPALALEYWNDPEKTAASFLTRDFGEGPVRCFKTGDLAQYDEAGNLVFAARSDFQIKHMGHRIELGEIEAVAGALPEVQRCCCVYDKARSKIVLFCQLAEDTPRTGQEIRSLLRPRLSSYMLPSRVRILEAMPLNANGKIDRAGLAASLSQQEGDKNHG